MVNLMIAIFTQSLYIYMQVIAVLAHDGFQCYEICNYHLHQELDSKLVSYFFQKQYPNTKGPTFQKTESLQLWQNGCQNYELDAKSEKSAEFET